MKRKTYNNIIKASKMIMKKGYEQKEAQEMTLRIFERMHDLQERHECVFDCGIDDVAIGSGTLKGFVFLREDLLEE